MMQITDQYNQRNSLFNAMHRFLGAVNNMDQTVMVPSLLRDVPLEEEEGEEEGEEDVKPVLRTASNGTATYFQDGDMYGSYVLLKSIRNDIEWGVLQGDERRKDKQVGVVARDVTSRVESSDEEDLEKRFHYHLNGLHSVLSKLTRKANVLTNRYKEEIGIRGCGH